MVILFLYGMVVIARSAIHASSPTNYCWGFLPGLTMLLPKMPFVNCKVIIKFTVGAQVRALPLLSESIAEIDVATYAVDSTT